MTKSLSIAQTKHLKKTYKKVWKEAKQGEKSQKAEKDTKTPKNKNIKKYPRPSYRKNSRDIDATGVHLAKEAREINLLFMWKSRKWYDFLNLYSIW